MCFCNACRVRDLQPATPFPSAPRFWLYCAVVACLYGAMVPFWFIGVDVLVRHAGMDRVPPSTGHEGLDIEAGVSTPASANDTAGRARERLDAPYSNLVLRGCCTHFWRDV